MPKLMRVMIYVVVALLLVLWAALAVWLWQQREYFDASLAFLVNPNTLGFAGFVTAFVGGLCVWALSSDIRLLETTRMSLETTKASLEQERATLQQLVRKLKDELTERDEKVVRLETNKSNLQVAVDRESNYRKLFAHDGSRDFGQIRKFLVQTVGSVVEESRPDLRAEIDLHDKRIARLEVIIEASGRNESLRRLLQTKLENGGDPVDLARVTCDAVHGLVAIAGAPRYGQSEGSPFEDYTRLTTESRFPAGLIEKPPARHDGHVVSLAIQGPAATKGDESWIYIAVYNLIKNARDHIIARRWPGDRVVVELCPDNRGIVLRVRNRTDLTQKEARLLDSPESPRRGMGNTIIGEVLAGHRLDKIKREIRPSHSTDVHVLQFAFGNGKQAGPLKFTIAYDEVHRATTIRSAVGDQPLQTAYRGRLGSRSAGGEPEVIYTGPAAADKRPLEPVVRPDSDFPDLLIADPDPLGPGWIVRLWKEGRALSSWQYEITARPAQWLVSEVRFTRYTAGDE